MKPRRFLISFVLCVVFLACCVPLVNVLIDPFGIFHVVNVPGVNAQRVNSAALARLAKADRACIVGPVSAIMGTSRVEVGINPVHPGWHNEGPVYSMALAGTGISELEMTLRHLVRSSPRLSEVNVGIDFLMFNANREAVVYGTEVFGFDPTRLLLEPGDTCVKTYFHDFWDVLGLPALPYALTTVTGQFPQEEIDAISAKRRGAWVAQYDLNGYRGSYFNVLLQKTRQSGFRSIFGDATGQEAGYVRRVWRPLPTERFCLTSPGQTATLDVFRSLVTFAQQSGVKVNIFINPVHARLLLALREAGLWPIYEEWKRGLVAVNEEVSKDTGKEPLAIWDFSGFNAVSTERIPDPGDKSSEMKYWWESSHFQEAAGTLMMDRMLGYNSPDRTLPEDFGILLTPSSIEDWIIRTRAAALKFIADFPREADGVVTAIGDVLKDAKGTNCGFDAMALMEGSRLLQQGDTAGADTQFQEAVRLHKEDEARYSELGVPYRETAFPEILALAEQGVVLEPPLRTWREYVARARTREAAGDLRGALLDYDDTIRLAPKTVDLYPARGRLKLKLADYDGALSDFNESVKITPEDPSVTTLIETTLRRMRDSAAASATQAIVSKSYDEAIEILSAALEKMPGDRSLTNLLISAFNQRGRQRQAAGDATGALADSSASAELTAGIAAN